MCALKIISFDFDWSGIRICLETKQGICSLDWTEQNGAMVDRSHRSVIVFGWSRYTKSSHGMKHNLLCTGDIVLLVLISGSRYSGGSIF